MTLIRKGLKRKGPLPGPFQPSRLKYKCPVFECKSAKIRGDRIAEHFQSFANIIVLDKCNENVYLSCDFVTRIIKKYLFEYWEK